MHCHLYLRKGIVIVPTFGKVDKGLHRDVEPVDVAPVADAAAIRRALHATIARGNPPTPPYPRGAYPQPVAVKYAGVKSWGAFARHALPWNIVEKNGIYRIIGKRKDPNGWVEDPEQKIEFPPGATIDDVIDRMIAILQDAAQST
jgi:hypothetical protein